MQMVAGATRAPVALAQGVQAELVGDLRRIHGVGQILLVSKDQQHRVAKLVLQVKDNRVLTVLAARPPIAAYTCASRSVPPCTATPPKEDSRQDMLRASLGQECQRTDKQGATNPLHYT